MTALTFQYEKQDSELTNFRKFRIHIERLSYPLLTLTPHQRNHMQHHTKNTLNHLLLRFAQKQVLLYYEFLGDSTSKSTRLWRRECEFGTNSTSILSVDSILLYNHHDTILTRTGTETLLGTECICPNFES